MARFPLLLLLLPLSTTLACGDKPGDGTADDTGTPGDGGTGDGGTTSYEQGCVTVDGGGGYAWINDAVAVAAEGAEISLAACDAGTHVEDVVLDKAVVLVGKDDLLLEADDADAPLTITAAGVSVRGVAFEGVDVAVIVDGAADVGLSELSILDPDQWGVQLIGATGTRISQVVVTGAGDGGIAVEGGSAEIVDVQVSDGKGYGVLATGGAEVLVQGSTFSDISRSSTSADDGVGIGSEDSVVETLDNVVDEATSYGILAIGGTLYLSGDSITGGTFGVLASDADLQASSLSVTDAYTCGIYAFAPATVEILDSAVVGTPGEVLEVTPSEWNHAVYKSAGIFAVAPLTTVSDSSVSGYSGAGLFIAAKDGGTAELARLSLTDQGNHGLYVSGVDTVAEDVVVSGTWSTAEKGEEPCYAVDSDVGVTVVDAELDWSGGSVTDVEGYGISGIYGMTRVDGATISGTTCAGIMAFQGDANITYSDFSGANGGAFAGSVVSYEGESLYVGGSTFSDSQNEVLDRSDEFMDGGVLTRYDYYEWSGSDIQVWYGAAATITQNVFERGVNGVELYSSGVAGGESSATMSNNSFTDYKGLVLYVGPETSAVASDLSVSQHGPYSVACEDGTLDLTRATLDTGGTANTRTAVYENDVFTYDLELEANGPSFISLGCTLSADTLTVRDADTTAVHLEDGAWELQDVVVEGAGLADDGDGLYAAAISGSSTLYIDGMDVSGVMAGSGLSVDAYAAISVNLFDLRVDGGSGDGVVLSSASGASASTSATITSLVIDGAAGTGLKLEDFSTTMSAVDVSGSGADGISLTGGTTGLTGSVSTGNAGFGMVCDGTATLSSCDVDLAGNTAGDSDGCEEWCGGGDSGGDGGATDGGAGDGGATDGGATDGGGGAPTG